MLIAGTSADEVIAHVRTIVAATDLPVNADFENGLAKDEKEYNRALSSFRVRIEHVFARLKSFRILRDVFRYPRATYHATIRIVAGILNLQAGFQPR